MTLDRLRYELRLLGKPVFLTPILVVIGFALLLALVNRNVDTVAHAMSGSLEGPAADGRRRGSGNHSDL